MSAFDVVIVGGGMVGASLALGLAGTGVSTMLIEGIEPGSQAQPSFDDRTTALGNASRRIFQSLGVWPLIEPDAAAMLVERYDGTCTLRTRGDGPHAERGEIRLRRSAEGGRSDRWPSGFVQRQDMAIGAGRAQPSRTPPPIRKREAPDPRVEIERPVEVEHVEIDRTQRRDGEAAHAGCSSATGLQRSSTKRRMTSATRVSLLPKCMPSEK